MNKLIWVAVLTVIVFVGVRSSWFDELVRSYDNPEIQAMVDSNVRRNPLLDIPPNEFWRAVYPVIDTFKSGEGCRRMWARDDAGSADCKPVAQAIANLLKVDSVDVFNQQLWQRYAIADYKGRSRIYLEQNLNKTL